MANKILKISEIFKALGEPNRLKITLLLSKRDLCVCEIVEILPVSFSTISSHLKILLNAGVVEKRREGRWIFYSLNKNQLILDILNTILKELGACNSLKELYKKLETLNPEICSINIKDGGE